MSSLITVSAVVFFNPAGHILTVRKNHTSRFMLVGGKPEPGEHALETAIREAAEETGVTLRREELTRLGQWRTAAANEAGHEVRGVIFAASRRLATLPQPQREICELHWLDPTGPLPDNLAPLLHTCVLPGLVDQGYIAPSPHLGPPLPQDPQPLP